MAGRIGILLCTAIIIYISHSQRSLKYFEPWPINTKIIAA